MASDEFGFLEHLDRRGKPCHYCGEPSVDTLIVSDAPRGALLDIRIGLCAAHRREPEGLPAAETFRRRKARNVPQLGFDIDV